MRAYYSSILTPVALCSVTVTFAKWKAVVIISDLISDLLSLNGQRFLISKGSRIRA